MTIFKIPILTTDRLRLRAFKVRDLDAYAAMQANPEVMRYLVTGRTSTPVEVWRAMATSIGAWRCAATACGLAKKSTMVRLSELSAYFSPSTGRNRRSPIRSTGPFGDRVSRLKRRRPLATGCSSTFPCRGLRASSGRTIMHRSASRNGSAQSANAHSNCVARSLNIGCTTAVGGTRRLSPFGRNISKV